MADNKIVKTTILPMEEDFPLFGNGFFVGVLAAEILRGPV
jgi:hypothetical protein